MNKIVKFRFWTGKQMIGPIGQLEFFTNDTYLVNEEFPTDKLMQFTGLLDKNGKEIYEGDILNCPMSSQYVVNNLRDFFYDLGEWGDNEEEDEVIGNIYENPELLKP